MAVCGGDVAQYNILKEGTVEDYIVKMSNFVKEYEAAEKRAKKLKKRR